MGNPLEDLLAERAAELRRFRVVAGGRPYASYPLATAMTAMESVALAMLRGGCSFDDAANASGLSVERVTGLWSDRGASPRPPKSPNND